jgi:hypothetical protein
MPVMCILAVIFLAGSYAAAEQAGSVKLIPYSVKYPLIRSHNYPKATFDALRDPYHDAFGIRRFSRFTLETPRRTENEDPVSLTGYKPWPGSFDGALNDAYAWQRMYGGYGILGRGEDVFTRRGKTRREALKRCE